MRLVLEVEGDAAPRTLAGDGAQLIAFMSFAVSRGFGAQHPLIALADRLHETKRASLGPLTTFYEATVEDSEDREKLELAWQDAAILRASAAGLAAALRDDEQCGALARRAGAASLAEEAESLASGLDQAATKGLRARLSYEL